MTGVVRRRAGPACLRIAALGLMTMLAQGCERNASRTAACGAPLHPVQGVDVSRHQGDIDWGSVSKAGIRFVWMKATEGGDHLDVKFRQNWEMSRAVGLQRGAYHFVYWCRPAADQAAWFVANVPNDPDALPPVLDVEWNPQSQTCAQKVPRDKALADMKIILDAMERAFGKRPIIYAPADLYRDVLTGALQRYPLWVRDTDGVPALPYDRPWLIWQYSDTGSVPGIDGPVDRNCFAGSLTDWRTWLASSAN